MQHVHEKTGGSSEGEEHAQQIVDSISAAIQPMLSGAESPEHCH